MLISVSMNYRFSFLLLSSLLLLSACTTVPKDESPYPTQYSTPDSPCFKAVIQNNIEEVQKNSAICLKSKNSHGTTPLMLASSKGFGPIADLLIQMGMDVNEADKTGDTALNYAVVFNQVDVAQLLILNRASIETQKTDGITVLMTAVQRGSPQMIRTLAQHPEGVNQRAEDGWTALYFAVRRKDEYILKHLLQKGACPNNFDSYHQTPLDFAKEIKWSQGVKILKNAKACPQPDLK